MQGISKNFAGRVRAMIEKSSFPFRRVVLLSDELYDQNPVVLILDRGAPTPGRDGAYGRRGETRGWKMFSKGNNLSDG